MGKKKKIRISLGHNLGIEDHTGFVIPGVMATPTLATTNLALINACDATTGWDLTIGSGPGGGVNADVFIQGTGSISRNIDNADKGFGYDVGVGNELDFTDGGANQFDSIFFWVNILQPDSINSMRLRLSSDTGDPDNSSWLEWRIFPDNEYKGGWYRASINPLVGEAGGYFSGARNSFAESGILDFSSIRWVAFMFDMANISGSAHNCLIDEIRIGRGLVVTGGTSGDKFGWPEIADVDAASAYGIVQRQSGIFFVAGEVQFGNGTADCFFEDTDSVVVFEPKLKGGDDRAFNLTTMPANWEDFNKISFDEGTGTVDFINGIKQGSGDDAGGTNGCVYIAAASGNAIQNFVTFDFSGAITNVELFGCRFINIVGDPFDEAKSIIFSDDATDGPNHEVSGCTFKGCGRTLSGRVVMRNNIFAATGSPSAYATFAEVKAWREVEAVWVDGTSGVADRSPQSFEPWDSNDANTDDAMYFGADCPFEGIDISQDSDRIDGAVTIWEYWNGDAWTTLGSLTQFPSASATEINGRIHWTVPIDWVKTSIDSGSDYFFARVRITSGFNPVTPEPQFNWCYGEPEAGATLVWEANSDVKNCKFVGNADADAGDVGCGIEHPSVGTAAYVGLEFDGNDFDVFLVDPATLVDSYDFSNQDDDQRVGNGTIVGIGQSITGVVGDLSKAVFYLKKVLSPTGNLTANLYAHSGTFGSSSVPTGAALATSLPLDVSTLTTSYVRTVLEFQDDFTMAAINYVIVLEYSGGDGTNYVDCAMDSSSPTHGGNSSEDTGSWAANSGEDLVFRVYAGTLAITATGGSDPSTVLTCDETTVIIDNLVDVTLTGLQANTEIRVFDTGTIIELDGVENSGTSFTFQADASAVVDIVIHHISYVHIFIEAFDMPSVDTSIPITQQFDRVYSNP